MNHIKLPGWNKINEWAIEYHEEVKKGYSGVVQYTRTGKVNDLRNDHQIDLINKIIPGCLPYITQIATLMKSDKGHFVHSGRFVNRLSLNDDAIKLEDMVQDGSLFVIRRFGKYDPSRGSASTFIGVYAAYGMFKYSTPVGGILPTTGRFYQKAKKIILEGKDKNSVIENLAKMEVREHKLGFTSASFIYSVLNKRIISLGMAAYDNSKESLSDFLSGSDEIGADEKMVDKEMCQRLDDLLKTLDRNDEYIVRQRFGLNEDYSESILSELADEYSLSKERIRQICIKAMGKLSRTKEARELVEYLK